MNGFVRSRRGDWGFCRGVAGFEVALFPHGHGIGAAQAGRTGSLKPEQPLNGFVRSKWRDWIVPAEGVRQRRGSGWLCSLSAEGFRLSGRAGRGSLHPGCPQRWVCSLKMTGVGVHRDAGSCGAEPQNGFVCSRPEGLGSAVENGFVPPRGEDSRHCERSRPWCNGFVPSGTAETLVRPALRFALRRTGARVGLGGDAVFKDPADGRAQRWPDPDDSACNQSRQDHRTPLHHFPESGLGSR